MSSSSGKYAIRARDGIGSISAKYLEVNIDADDGSSGIGALGSVNLSSSSSGVTASSTVKASNLSGLFIMNGSLAGSLALKDNGLNGQVVVNAAVSGATWTGSVVVGSTTLPNEYAAVASTLGGGAAGYAPFAIHLQDSTPVGFEPTTSMCPVGNNYTILTSEFRQSGLPNAITATGATLTFYGPVRLAATGPWFSMQMVNCDGTAYEGSSDIGAVLSATQTFVGGLSRKIVIKGPTNYVYPKGRYRIKPLANKIFCDNQVVPGDVQIQDFDYLFYISTDCNADGTADLGLCFGGPCDTADFDKDGDTGTDDDIEAFFACLAGFCCAGCSADFDNDGNAGTDADIEAFFFVLAGGQCG